MKRIQLSLGLFFAVLSLAAHSATYVMQVSLPNYPPQQMAGDDMGPFTKRATFERPEVIAGVVKNALVDYALVLDARTVGNNTSLFASFTQRQSAVPALSMVLPGQGGQPNGTGATTITSCREFSRLMIGQTLVLQTSIGPIRITPVRINPIAISPGAGSALSAPKVQQMSCGAPHPGGLQLSGGPPSLTAPAPTASQ